MSDEIRVRIWHGSYGRHNDYPDEPDETVPLPIDENIVWQDDPWYDSGPIAFDIHPDDAPATLYIYTNDSVRAPHKDDLGEWGRAVERGLEFDPKLYARNPPFGCEIWGRVLFRVEEGFTR